MFKLSAARDQEPVETVTADRADPAFGEGVRVGRAERGTDDLDVHASEDVVECTRELAVAIMDQKPDRPRAFRQRPGKLPLQLSRPAAVRVWSATGVLDKPRAELDEEEHIQAAEPERLNGEEVAGEHRRGMGMEEVAPAELRATASRRHAGLPEDRGDRRRRDTPADACQLA